MMTRFKALVAGLCLLVASGVNAQVTVPNTLAAGTTITSSALNTNFTTIANHALDRISGGTMTGTLTAITIVPSSSNAYDFGSTSAFWRSVYAKTSLVLGQTTANYTLTWANPAAARAISFEDPLGTDIVAYKAATQTLTNKTLTAPAISAPVLSGSATGTYTLAGTPTITAPAISAPVFSGSATGTYTLAGTPTITAPTISSPVLSGTVTGTYTIGGTPTIPASGLTGTITLATQDLITRLGTIVSGVWNAGAVTSSGILTGTVLHPTAAPAAAGSIGFSSNTLIFQGGTSGHQWTDSTNSNALMTISDAGDAAFGRGTANPLSFTGASTGASYLRVTNTATTFYLGVDSSTAGSFATGNNAAILYTGSSPGISIAAAHASGALRFYSGGTAQRASYDASGNYILGTANITDAVATPTIGSGFGTSPSIAGKDYAFRVTVGSGSPTSGVVTFNATYANAPVCVANGENGANYDVGTTSTTTQVTVSFSAALNVGTLINVLCRGY